MRSALFKSLGIAIEDLASAHRIYGICKERALGTWVEIGGAHFGAVAEDSTMTVAPYPEFFNDVLGPVMQPGSSSHLPGHAASATGRMPARRAAGAHAHPPRQARLFAGTSASWPRTGPWSPASSAISPTTSGSAAFELAEEAGAKVEFEFTRITESDHPNAVKFVLTA